MLIGRTAYLALGMSLIPIGAAGVALPVLPGTPLLLVAAWCFARSSPRLEAWLVDHPRLGPPIRAWREFGAIPFSAKCAASAALAGSFLFMLTSFAPLGAKVIAGLVMLGAGGFIWSRPDA